MEIIDIPISVVIGIGHTLNNEIFQTMDMTTRERIKNIIEIFYRPKFKIFNINSLDGKVFNHLEGVFVSLGITTSMKVMEDIAEVINTEDSGLKATVAEISSKKVVNQYLNTVTKKTEVEQYLIPNLDDPGLLDKEASLKLLESLKQNLSEEADLEDLKNLTPKISKLATLIQKLDKSSGWDGHMIQEDGEEFYRIFHKFVNYKKVGDIEYRIGIYVEEEIEN
jgi:hypothetical protein